MSIMNNKDKPSQLWRRINSLIDEMIRWPINDGYKFSEFTEEFRKCYRNFDESACDLKTIKKKLLNREYKTPLDWYRDVELLYETGKQVHKNSDIIWTQLMDFCLEKFRRETRGLLYNDANGWYEEIKKEFGKLTKTMTSNPIPQYRDPLISFVVKKSEAKSTPYPQNNAELVQNINRIIENENARRDVLVILNETQPDLKITGESFEVDADALNMRAINALHLYISSLS